MQGNEGKAMRLARVVFRKPRKVGNMELAGCEVTENNIENLSFDEKTNTVVLGDVHVPREEVVEMERLNEELVCPDCEKSFANAQALGGHRKHKHQGAA